MIFTTETQSPQRMTNVSSNTCISFISLCTHHGSVFKNFLLITACAIFCLFFAKGSAESPDNVTTKKYYLVACAIFQDETLFLKEWLEYHKLIGIEHFYLYNNLSTDNYKEVLKPYIEEGIVDLLEWDVETHNQAEYLNRLQRPAYMHALESLKDRTVWAAFIDLDEFLLPMRHGNLHEVLKDYEDYAGLAINWQLFGTSGVQSLPADQLLIENLVWKASPQRPLNQFIKLIVKPHTVKTVHDPHYFEFHEGYFAVDSTKKPLDKGQRGQEIVLDTICINHYWFGTLDWFLNNKIPRREKWGIVFPKEHLEEIIAAYNEINDGTILKFAPALKQAMYKSIPYESK